MQSCDKGMSLLGVEEEEMLLLLDGQTYDPNELTRRKEPFIFFYNCLCGQCL